MRALPVAAEVDRRPAPHRQPDDVVDLLAVADAAEILPPGRFAAIANEIRPGDMVVMAEFAAAQTGEIGFCAIGAGAADAEAVLMVDPQHGEAGVQRVPRRALIGMNRGAFGNPLTDHRHGIRLGREYLCQRSPATFAHRHHYLAFARLVLGKAPVDPLDGEVLRPDMAAEIGAVDLGRASLTADAQRAHARRHGLAQFGRQNESALVLHIEIAGEGEHAFALHLVAEHRNGHQVGPERQLVPGEQGARRHREIPTAGLAAPTWLTARAATVVTDPAGAVRTDRLAVRLRPSQAQKHIFRAL